MYILLGTTKEIFRLWNCIFTIVKLFLFTQLLSLLSSLFPLFLPQNRSEDFHSPQLSLKFSLSCKEMQVKNTNENIWLRLGNDNWFSFFSQVNVRQYMKTTASRWCVKNIVVWCTSRWQGLCFTKREGLSFNSPHLSIFFYFDSGYNDYSDIGITSLRLS